MNGRQIAKVAIATLFSLMSFAVVNTSARPNDFPYGRASALIERGDCQKAWEIMRGKLGPEPSIQNAFTDLLFRYSFRVYPLMKRGEDYERFILAASIVASELIDPNRMMFNDAALGDQLHGEQKEVFVKCLEIGRPCRSEAFRNVYGVSANEDLEDAVSFLKLTGSYGICPSNLKRKPRYAPSSNLADILRN